MTATILCVQDDREVARVHRETLEAEGFEVLCAHDGRRCLATVARQTPDLVMLDVYLPRQDGFEILAELRQMPAGETLPVLLVSEGDITHDVRARADALGAIGVESAPIAPSHLIARVRSQLEAEKKLRSVSAPTPARGSFREVPVPELLRSLHVDAFDGALMIAHGKKKKAIEFRGGWPVSVKSNLLSECFGGFLVERGLASQRELDESVERMRTGEGLQGEILVAMAVMDEADVVAALQQHAVEKFLEIFSWRAGTFELRPGAHVQRGSTIGLQGHPSKLIVDGVRRRYSLKQIDRYFERHAQAFLVPIPHQEDRLDEVGLREREVNWLRGLDGTVRIRSVQDAPESIRRLVFGLISIEVLGVDDRRGGGADALAGVRAAADSTASQPPEPLADESLRAELTGLANGMQDKDHYQVLGVSRSANDDEIRVAYASLAKRAHPDRFHSAGSSVRQLAAQVFERVSQAHEAIGTAEGRARYAQSLTLGRREAEAEQEGRRALKAENEYQRGEALIAARDYEGALVCFGRAMEHFPSEGEYRAHYGWCLYLCHPDNEVMLAEALEHCREGLKLAKDREKPYLLLGRLYKAMGKPGAAKKMFSRAVEIKPQCVEAMRELRIMNMRREKDKGVLKRIFRR